MKRKVTCLLSLVLCMFILSGCGLVVLTDKANIQVPKPEKTEDVTPESGNIIVTPPPEKVKVDENKLPGDYPMDFYFSSGAGGWGTSLVLNSDGSFTGEFHDSNMGETGPNYPNGTVYVCDFDGKFGNVQKINDYTYKMTLQDIRTDKAVDTQWIEDDILYVASEPYGLDTGVDFIFYTPDAKTDSLSEDFLSWWPYRFEEGDMRDRLSCYGIYNLDGESGFFTY